MLAKVTSAANLGLECEIIEVEVDLHPCQGQPSFTVVGLGDIAVQESRERVRSAVKNSGFEFLAKRITVNLAPADLRKSGPSFDLPIALGMLLATRQLGVALPPATIFLGELSLKGELRHVNGILPLVLAATKRGFKNFFVPAINGVEAALVEGAQIFPVKTLAELAEHLSGLKLIAPLPVSNVELLGQEIKYETDLANVRGQEHAKRALTIAAAGGHNVLFNGPPGSGKTMLARAFRTILPALTLAEMLEVTKIYSVAGLLPDDRPLVTTRPFRTVHHTASAVSIVGGGRMPGPGEISLAHKGVLLLDEIAEFPATVLEVLRQPLEDGVITISRASGTLQFPARFTLIGTMNPCPCGFATDPERACKCTANEILRYQKKLSGPLLDRIDLHVEVPRVKFEKLTGVEAGETSEVVRARVEAARVFQKARFKNTKCTANAEMTSEQTKKFCVVDKPTEDLLRQAVSHFQLSARAYYRILKLARTIADLAGVEKIELSHVAEALQYRPKNGTGV